MSRAYYVLGPRSFGGRDFSYGDVVDEQVAGALGAMLEPMAFLPVDRDALLAHPCGGVGAVHFGARGIAIPPTTPTAVATAPLYALSRTRSLHWRALLVADAPGPITGRLGVTGATNAPGLANLAVRGGMGDGFSLDAKGPGVYIGGSAELGLPGDVLAGVTLYGSARNARLAWFGVSQA